MRKIGGDKTESLIEAGAIVFKGFKLVQGIVALNGNTPNNPGDLYTLDLSNKKLEKRTVINPWVEKKKLGEQVKLSYKSRDGIKIEGVLIYPVGYKQGETYPLN